MFYDFNIDENLIKLSNKVEEKIKPQFDEINRIAMINSSKVLKAFQSDRQNGEPRYVCSAIHHLSKA